MKIKNLIAFFFADFAFIRSWIGGTWYKIIDEPASGLAGSAIYWTRQKPDDFVIIESEVYG